MGYVIYMFLLDQVVSVLEISPTTPVVLRRDRLTKSKTQIAMASAGLSGVKLL